MKVGTDGVLLGAWANPISSPKNILDIGTGTGLIAIMMAQRFSKANIIAIDIDPEAVKEAKFNMNSTQWKNRLTCLNTSLQDIDFEYPFDLIVCNPPFFKNTTKPNNKRRSLARHSNGLSLNDIFEKMNKLLTNNGELMLVYPSDSIMAIKENVKLHGLNINEICWVRGNEKSNVKRILLKISKRKTKLIDSHLTIEKERHHYTDDYVNLCKEFYLNL